MKSTSKGQLAVVVNRAKEVYIDVTLGCIGMKYSALLLEDKG